MTPIQYIGKKEQMVDHAMFAGTMTTWNGPGDIQNVPDKAVPILLKYPDTWRLPIAGVPASEPGSLKPVAEGNGETAQTDTEETEIDVDNADTTYVAPIKDVMTEVDQKAPMVALDNLDADGLRSYAQQHFGHTFHHNTGEDRMRNEIIAMMNRG